MVLLLVAVNQSRDWCLHKYEPVVDGTEIGVSIDMDPLFMAECQQKLLSVHIAQTLCLMVTVDWQSRNKPNIAETRKLSPSSAVIKTAG